MKPHTTQDDLASFPQSHDALIGIDSDGCVFDSMVTKQCEFFHPHIIRTWNLEAIEPQLRETAEFVNLNSAWRGSNRFMALLKVFEWLPERTDIDPSSIALPDPGPLRTYLESGVSLGHPSLEQAVEQTNNPELSRLLDWSVTLNRDIAENMAPIPPFNGVRETLEELQDRADLLVVSQTPEAALIQEWDHHDLHPYVSLIAGQELGTKADHLRQASAGRYPLHQILKVGDAPGDLQAAETVGCCFFPILPGEEEASWQRLRTEGLSNFFEGTFQGPYQDELKEAFRSRLPAVPPWPVRTSA